MKDSMQGFSQGEPGSMQGGAGSPEAAPVPQSAGDEFGSVVHAQMGRSPALARELLHGADDAFRGDAAPGFHSKRLRVNSSTTLSSFKRLQSAVAPNRKSSAHTSSGRRARSRCDFIFDATVNTSVSATLDDAQKQGLLGVPVVQTATDNQTATLGIVTVTDGTPENTTENLDQALHRKAVSDPDLTPFHMFWDRNSHPPLTPAPGCSIPTFHGSAADAMGVAASAVSVAAVALSRRIAGGYLISLPHSPCNAPAITPVQPPTRKASDTA